MNLEEILNYRRSVRVYDKDIALDHNKVKYCLELATLAPNSSNVQLWEFYHISSPELMEKFVPACLGQAAVSTASQLVVFVTRQDLHRKRAKAVLQFERNNIQKNSPPERQAKRIRDRELYYGKLMPFLYARFFGILGFFRKLAMAIVGIFRPIVHQVSENDMRIVVHKTCALAAQTFMIAMANEGYDTCPLEGFDSGRVKKLLDLPAGAEINMVVSCGIRKGNEGIHGDRFRLPFDEVYHHR
ncbi:nitroreductase family protein [Sphingobacterium sp. DN00404]|uniref:Nitroreductase family protein n=1 Tax=Sphingobacterium micropteri TaxID=2763501 RepID=A0ABR7YJV5_9SPHI|nr:nitroreductase family protein [Sphingobacterium micropteri]MBD1431541.1 nitroreductase family protein [Sphingobacterium micropteri]